MRLTERLRGFESHPLRHQALEFQRFQGYLPGFFLCPFPACTWTLLTAVNYSLNQEKGLRVYLEDGRLDISNNFCENTIRPFCVGRRNWLFRVKSCLIF